MQRHHRVQRGISGGRQGAKQERAAGARGRGQSHSNKAEQHTLPHGDPLDDLLCWGWADCFLKKFKKFNTA